MSVAALILGIVAIASGWKFIGVIPGVIGLILGLIAFLKNKDKMALVGMLLSIAGIASFIAVILVAYYQESKTPITYQTQPTVAQSTQTTTPADSGDSYQDLEDAKQEIADIWGDAFGTGDKEKEEDSEDGVKKNKQGKKFNVGDVIEGKNFKLTYVSKGVHTNTNQFYEAKPNTKIVYVEVEVENISKSDKIVASTSFEVYADGYECDWYCNIDEDLSATLSPGRKAKGKAFYVVPDDAKEIEFEFDDDVWSSDKIILVY